MPTVTIQPSSADSYVLDSFPDNNYALSNSFVVGNDTSNGYTYRSFIMWSLSSIPAGAIVSAASVEIKNNTSTEAPGVRLTRITGSWTETGVTWNNQPAVTTTGSVAITVTSGGWHVWSGIASIVQGWIDGTFTNLGVRIKLDTETNNQILDFTSRDSGAIADRPKLIVTYNRPPTAPTGLSPSGTSYTLSQTVAFSWTHNDPDGDAQSAYEIRWRRSGSADAYSTLTATTSTQSRNEPASTFVAGIWEYNVRTKDTGSATFGAWSSTQIFTVVGKEYWGVIPI